MVRKSKWIDVCSPDEPVETIAAQGLRRRLNLVWHYLELAAQEAEDDVEHVHQLRVAARRAVATMEMFEPLLPARRSLAISKQLRRVRKAAGDARDLDVLAMRLEKRMQAEHDAPLRPLLQEIERRRHRAQEPIEEAYERLRKKFPRGVRRLLKRVKLRSKVDKLSRPTFECFARRALRPLVDDLLIAAAGDFSDYQALHAFRIESKRLRYAMEIFAGAFEPSFRDDLYPMVEDLQEHLGEINDHATAKALFDAWAAENPEPELCRALAEVAQNEAAAIEERRRKFLEWWNTERQAALREGLQQELSLDVCVAPSIEKAGSAPEQVPAHQSNGEHGSKAKHVDQHE